MKIPLLPEIDLARISPQPPEAKWRALEQFRIRFPPHSYAPVRASLSDILNVEAGMLAPLPRTPWSKIAESIHKASRSEDEETANLQVGKGLYSFADSAGLRGRRHDFMPLGFGIGKKVVFWHNSVLTLDGRATIPFFDPRRTKSLTAVARQFVFSVMHERIRAADPDFAGVAFGIFKFAITDDEERAPIIHLDEGIPLFSFDDLQYMVEETYVMWREVFMDRTAEARRSSGGSGGELL